MMAPRSRGGNAQRSEARGAGALSGQALLEYAVLLTMVSLIAYASATSLCAYLQAWYEAALAPIILALDRRLPR